MFSYVHKQQSMIEDIPFRKSISFWDGSYKIPRSNVYIYFDEAQTTSIQGQKIQDGRLRAYMEYFC